MSHTSRNPGQTPSFTRTPRGVSLLQEVVHRKCVGGIWCASALASGTNFQACSFSVRHLYPQCIRPAAPRRARRLGAELGTERNGSIDRHLPNAPPRDTSARASGPERTTDQISGRRIMRVTRRAPISCRHCCRRKEPLRSHQRSGSVERRQFAPSPRAGRDNLRSSGSLSLPAAQGEKSHSGPKSARLHCP